MCGLHGLYLKATRRIIFLLLMSVTTCVATHAEEVNWASRVADHSWKAVGNWHEHAPVSNDDVIIDRHQNYTWIESGTVASCRTLIVAKEKGNRGECRLIVNGGDLTINGGSLAIGLQSNAKGRVHSVTAQLRLKGLVPVWLSVEMAPVSCASTEDALMQAKFESQRETARAFLKSMEVL